MFEKKTTDTKNVDDDLGVFRPTKGSAKVIVGNGVKLKGEITDADELQVDGQADITVITDNLIVGSTGSLKGNIQSDNADVWGKIDGDLKISGTLTIQEQGVVSGTVEYQNVQIKLGGKMTGDIKVSDKVKKISDVSKKSTSLQDTVKEQNS